MSVMGNAIGGWPQGVPGYWQPQQQNVQAASSQWQGVQNVPWPTPSGRLHLPLSADEFKSLTAYVRSLLRCEPKCECKWCSASELERQVAIAQFFKDEPAEE